MPADGRKAFSLSGSVQQRSNEAQSQVTLCQDVMKMRDDENCETIVDVAFFSQLRRFIQSTRWRKARREGAQFVFNIEQHAGYKVWGKSSQTPATADRTIICGIGFSRVLGLKGLNILKKFKVQILNQDKNDTNIFVSNLWSSNFELKL